MSTNSGLTSSHAGTTSSTIGGIPNNTATADPKAVQAASGGPQSSTESHGPAISTNYNNIERTSGTNESGTKSAASGVKGIAAAVHGAGEKIRGTFNKGVDDAFHEDQGVAKNSKVAAAGDSEIATGKFAASTKNREGALPGADHESRHAQANTDLNRE